MGHYPRELPEGYVETLRTGQNRIVDPQTHQLYEALALITRGPLLEPQRLATVVRMNLLGQP